MKKNFLLVVGAALFASACNKSETSEPLPKPIISILNTDMVTADICGHDEDNVIHVLTNDTLVLFLKFEGVNPLSQYKLSSHENSDCHDHESFGESISEDWTVNEIVDVTGTSLEVVKKFAIPDDTHIGNYHFTIQLVDINGVEADTKELNIVIANP